jgi:hypothetical protein
MKLYKKIGRKFMAIAHDGTSLGLYNNKLLAKRKAQEEHLEFNKERQKLKESLKIQHEF